METTAESTRNNISSIMHYWGLVKNLDDKLKLELVSMLISSMRLSSVADEEEREKGFRSLSGCWANDHGDDDIEAITARIVKAIVETVSFHRLTNKKDYLWRSTSSTPTPALNTLSTAMVWLNT